jgi:hypothetical protein
MKTLCRIVILCLLISALSAATLAENDAPYIAYYSHTLNGVVIERADGSDSRLIGQDVVEHPAGRIFDTGWSPDGKWFAWQVEDTSEQKSRVYAVSSDGQHILDVLDDFPNVHWLQWSPNGRYILIFGVPASGWGEYFSQTPFPTATYWLVDVVAQKRIATYSITVNPDYGDMVIPTLNWGEDDVTFHTIEQILAANPTRVLRNYYRIALSYEGEAFQHVLNQIVHEEDDAPELDAALQEIFGESPLVADFVSLSLYVPNPEASFDSPDGRFLYTDGWLDTETGDVIALPNNLVTEQPSFVEWDASAQWVLAGFDVCADNCMEVQSTAVHVMNPATGLDRQIASCGQAFACVSWLPDIVDIATLPAGQSTSVITQ